MSTILLRIATTITRAWTRLYTVGLVDDAGRARREEVASDLWEQTHDATAAKAVAFSILARLVRGLPDDLAWRALVARRLGTPQVVFEGTGWTPSQVNLGPVVPAAAFWLLTLVILVAPMPHSLVYAGGVMGLVAVAGWLIEARRSGDETPRSAWPAATAVSIGAVAMGAVFDSGRLGLVLSAPSAVVFTSMAVDAAVAGRATAQASVASVAPEVMHRHAIAGDAIAIERFEGKRVSRRAVLEGSVWLGLGAVLATAGGVIVDFLWSRDVAGFGGIVPAGNVSEYTPGSKTKIAAGKFWLVHLTPEQGGPGFLALYQKCPHLGCTVPWEADLSLTDKATSRTKRGWFRCPCHQSTYDDAGVRVFGPAPRSMDRMALTIGIDGEIEVDTSSIERGVVENAVFAVKAPEV